MEESQNQRVRQRVVEWLTGTAYSRLNSKGSIIVVGARWHHQDLKSFLITEHSDRWCHINYPALSEGKDDPLKRPKGTPLAPELFDAEALEQIKNAIGPEKWQAQYMQEPLPDKAENGVQVVFPEDMIKQIGESPLSPFEKMPFAYSQKALHYIGFDIGMKRSHSALLVCQIFETDDPDAPELHIIHLKRFPLDTRLRTVIDELDILSFDGRFGDLCPIILLDGSGYGGELAAELIHEKRIKPVIKITIISTGKGSTSKRTVPKKDLIENLQDFISEGRLKISPRLRDADLLYEELRGHRSQSSPQGRTITFRPTGRDGKDDLLDGLSLICWAVFKRWKIYYARQAEGLYEDSLPTRRPISRNRRESFSSISKSQYSLYNEEFAELRGWR